MNRSVTRRFFSAALLVGLSGCMTTPASTERVVTIDMRDGVTPEKMEAYRAAVLGGSEASVSRVVRLLISGDKGFDAGILQIPSHRRYMNIWVHIYVFRGNEITAPLKVNLYSMDAQTVKNINMEVALR